MSSVLAPTAPGRLGERLDPPAVQAYLANLDDWVLGRKDELAEIDAAALQAPDRDSLSGDMILSMTLWKAVADRQSRLLAVWDGGRVGPTEREALSRLIWGRLDDDPSVPQSVSVSLPEACRLSDALAASLRQRLALSPAADANARRLAAVRATLDRLRDQVALEPPSSQASARAALDKLVARTDEVTARLERGGDIGGLIGPLENDSSTMERDLIVGGARRRESRDLVAAIGAEKARLSAVEAEVSDLAARTVEAVDPAPLFAVPDVSLLGDVPTDPGALTAYRTRLDRVGKALDLARERYAAALAERDTLRAQVEALGAKARQLGVGEQPDVAAAAKAAAAILERKPAPIAVARHLVGAYQAWIDLTTRH